MAGNIDVKKVAVTLGLLFAVWYIGWAVVMLAFGSQFINWFMELHFISTALAVAPFDVVTFIIGVVGFFLCGAITGAIFAALWNALKM